MDAFGMPKPISGASSSVFTVRGADGRRWAVKCFTRFVDHQAVRYQRISETLQTARKPWRVEFEYLREGVLCGGIWYPVVKMEWIEATGLIPFIERHLWEPAVIADLAEKFTRMVRDLSALNIAHGDLQHGNLLITSSGELKLIDYDGMFVPSLAQMGACEKGHVNYQSPTRTMSTWGSYLDNFSAWIIYTSLVALTIDPTLWSLLHAQGDEALLFHHADYEDARHSRALLALAQSSSLALQPVGTLMRSVWAPDVRGIPPLNTNELPQLGDRPVLSPSTSRLAPTTTMTVPTVIPDWVTEAQGVPHPTTPSSPGDSSWVTGHLPPLQPVAFNRSRLESRLSALLSLIIIAAVAISAGFGQLSVLAAGIVSWFVISGFIALTTFLFRRTPEWRAKGDKLAIFKEYQAETSKGTRDVAKQEAAMRNFEKREKEHIDKTSQLADKARADEQKELAAVNAKLAAEIHKLQMQRQSLAASEDNESANALRLLQQQHTSAYLRRFSISSAKISGIGDGIVSSLASNGVRTAADFTGIAYSSGPRGGIRQALIRLRDGRYIHPSGVGEKKAEALDSWRRRLEIRALATQPPALPSAEAQAIKAKYAQQRQHLANEEQTARTRASDEQRQISQRWMQTHTSISAHLLSARQAFAQERAQISVQLTAAKKQASAASWQRDLAAREVSAHRNVSYLQFLAGIIKVLQEEPDKRVDRLELPKDLAGDRTDADLLGDMQASRLIGTCVVSAVSDKSGTTTSVPAASTRARCWLARKAGSACPEPIGECSGTGSH
jgi:hypothetical protein